MIVTPSNQDEWSKMAGFMLALAGVQPNSDMQFIGWVSDGNLVLAVAFTGFLGHVCQIHVAMAPGWTYIPKGMLKVVFDYAFGKLERKMLIGIVNSLNEKAMSLDLGLGFKEIARLRKMHDDGGDIVILGMLRSECKYLKGFEAEQAVLH